MNGRIASHPLGECWAIIFMLVAFCPSGCRDIDPPPTHPADLGTEGRSLIAVSSTWIDPAIREGTSEWRPFRDPAKQDAEKPKTDGGKLAGAKSSEIEKELRSLIDDFNELAAKGDLDGVLGYVVEQQQAAMKQVLEVVVGMKEKLTKLSEALEEKTPGSGKSAIELRELLGASTGLQLNIESIKVFSATEAVGIPPNQFEKTSPMTATEVQFVQLEEDWYVKFPQLETAGTMLPMLKTSLEQFDGLIEMVRSGQVQPDAVAQQLSQAKEMIQKASSSAANTPGNGETPVQP